MAELTEKPLSAFQVRAIKAIVGPASALNVWLYRLSGGEVMGTYGGGPVCLVTMTGRKTGKKRTLPLMYNPRGDDVILVASRAGTPACPNWYHNLMANPEIEVEVGRDNRRYNVRQADDTEKAELWPLLVGNYKDFDLYQNRTERNNPVRICSPVD
jgi:deazaflavin-dependent oxidoreductase (nitroreductase family)